MDRGKEAAKARFMSKVRIGPTPEACWEWQAGRFKTGYAAFWMNGRMQRANRIAYWLFVGDPGELFVLHRCDNRKCVNPKHLFLGTSLTNVRDMHAKGRHRHGNGHHNAKLTESNVFEIRAMLRCGVTQQALADRFGVSLANISKIARRLTWKEAA